MANFYGIVVDAEPNLILTEYFVKGSLDDVLDNDFAILNFQMKVSMALDVITALDYLHNYCKITHGRLRSTNCMVTRYLIQC